MDVGASSCNRRGGMASVTGWPVYGQVSDNRGGGPQKSRITECKGLESWNPHGMFTSCKLCCGHLKRNPSKLQAGCAQRN